MRLCVWKNTVENRLLIQSCKRVRCLCANTRIVLSFFFFFFFLRENYQYPTQNGMEHNSLYFTNVCYVEWILFLYALRQLRKRFHLVRVFTWIPECSSVTTQVALMSPAFICETSSHELLMACLLPEVSGGNCSWVISIDPVLSILLGSLYVSRLHWATETLNESRRNLHVFFHPGVLIGGMPTVLLETCKTKTKYDV